ncbi:hypothetical protein CRG98_009910 [Punica granatum]|uniref:Uncharacterized protein n=1 Tax=Punica granatum TaxID=22663 RepID=A0A2I0KMP9_PUNGR|nr:hypothetical protein CRG98_009910 [Punica granatum]
MIYPFLTTPDLWWERFMWLICALILTGVRWRGNELGRGQRDIFVCPSVAVGGGIGGGRRFSSRRAVEAFIIKGSKIDPKPLSLPRRGRWISFLFDFIIRKSFGTVADSTARPSLSRLVEEPLTRPGSTDRHDETRPDWHQTRLSPKSSILLFGSPSHPRWWLIVYGFSAYLRQYSRPPCQKVVALV